MRPVLATYRLQLHRGFTLDDARALVPYLHALGISHLHASPILTARPGSTHGYDVTDPTQVNPELGGEPALERLVTALHAQGMGLVLDIVPNHMAAVPGNGRWEDVLRLGSASPYAAWFDIDWRAGDTGVRERLVLPVLGDVRVRVLERDELALAFENGELRIRYFEHGFPLDPGTLPQVLGRASHACAERLGEDHADVTELAAVTEVFWRMPRRTSRNPRDAERRRELADEGCTRLRQLAERSPGIRECIEAAAAEYGSGAEGRVRLRRLLDQQPYRLVYWRRAAREVNYRRFFDINELVALHMENPEVFRAHHGRVLEWGERGWVDGYRIDHPDGLLDPAGYFDQLADAVFAWRPDARYPIWAEKILSGAERLRDRWPIAGTTGYDFLNEVENLFIDPEGWSSLERHYHRIIRRPLDFHAVARLSKRLVLETSFAAGVRRGADRLHALARMAGRESGVPVSALVRALTEFIVYLPVYRTYIDARQPIPAGDDAAILERTLAETAERGRAAPAALALVRDALLGADQRLSEGGGEQLRLRFVERLQQLSGPAAAKGVEDTALYRYVPLVSRNEVGGEPAGAPEAAVEEFHARNGDRAARWPLAMLAVTTHDTKRTADVRARIDVLSEMADEWEGRLYRWRRAARAYKRNVGGRAFPDTNTTWLFFQTLLGVWPMAHAAAGTVPDDDELAALRDRLTAYMEKAVREAKTHTSWTEPDAEYEAAVKEYVGAVLDRERSESLLADMARFVGRVARPGIWNALARTTLQLTSPGVPDVYQGDELWNLALVDPDNRRPVDWEARSGALAALDTTPPDELVRAAPDGRIKLLLYRRLLELRRAHPALFVGASYEPVGFEGERAENAVGFIRRADDRALLVVVPRLSRSLAGEVAAPVGERWGETVVVLPEELGERAWRSVLGEGSLPAGGPRLRLADLLGALPVGVWLAG